MGTFLFDKVVFGPVNSRRLGISLGINLLPINSKLCSFNCIYCECGFNQKTHTPPELPTREDVKKLLAMYFDKNSQKEKPIDVITFAGNGEPTLHPDFAGIISDTIDLRNHYAPSVKIAVLSNATRIHINDVFLALSRVDENILKLDSANPQTIALLNCPQGDFNLDHIILHLKRFNNLIIQTLFIKGQYHGKIFDNSSENELKAWLKLIISINPQKVMIYTFARDTAAPGLEKIDNDRLLYIAGLVEKAGIKTLVSA